MATDLVKTTLLKLSEIERILHNHGIFADSQRDHADPSGDWTKEWFHNSGNNSKMFWYLVYCADPAQCSVVVKLSDDDGHGLGIAYLGAGDQWSTCHENPEFASTSLQILVKRFPQGVLTESQAYELISCMAVYHGRRKGTSVVVSP